MDLDYEAHHALGQILKKDDELLEMIKQLKVHASF